MSKPRNIPQHTGAPASRHPFTAGLAFAGGALRIDPRWWPELPSRPTDGRHVPRVRRAMIQGGLNRLNREVFVSMGSGGFTDRDGNEIDPIA